MLSDEYLDGDLLGERTTLWIDRLTDPPANQRVLIAEVNQDMAGFACAFFADDPKLGTLLDNLHVLPEFQRQGIGFRLMSEIAFWCHEQSPGEGLFLWVIEANSRARNFYQRHGADIVDSVNWISPDGGSIPSLCYAWKNLAPLLVKSRPD
jgi:GNAT superfamily N-acetyltransferase